MYWHCDFKRFTENLFHYNSEERKKNPDSENEAKQN